MYCERRKQFPILPSTFQQVEVPEHLKSSISNERFFQKEIEHEEGKILIFSSQSQIEKVAKSSIILGDGTFYSAPHQGCAILYCNILELSITYCNNFMTAINYCNILQFIAIFCPSETILSYFNLSNILKYFNLKKVT